jgi:hypothetical protein
LGADVSFAEKCFWSDPGKREKSFIIVADGERHCFSVERKSDLKEMIVAWGISEGNK